MTVTKRDVVTQFVLPLIATVIALYIFNAYIKQHVPA